TWAATRRCRRSSSTRWCGAGGRGSRRRLPRSSTPSRRPPTSASPPGRQMRLWRRSGTPPWRRCSSSVATTGRPWRSRRTCTWRSLVLGTPAAGSCTRRSVPRTPTAPLPAGSSPSTSAGWSVCPRGRCRPTRTRRCRTTRGCSTRRSFTGGRPPRSGSSSPAPTRTAATPRWRTWTSPSGVTRRSPAPTSAGSGRSPTPPRPVADPGAAVMAWAPDYVTVSDLAAYLRIGDDLDDAELAVAITAASRAVDHFCGRQFGRTDAPVERFYTARRDYTSGWWAVDVDDLAEPPVTVEVAGHPVTSYTLGPRNAAANGKPWTRIEFDAGSERLPTGSPGEVSVTGTWGWDAVPATVQQATLL